VRKCNINYASYIIIFLFLPFVFSCNKVRNEKNNTKNSEVDFSNYSVSELTFAKDGNFIRPKFSENDSTVCFLNSDLSSLFCKKNNSESIKKIYSSGEKITDFIPFNHDSSFYLVERNYSPKSKFKSRLLFVKDKKAEEIFSSAEVISALSLTRKNNIVFFEGNRIKFYEIKNNKITDTIDDDYESVYIDTTSISLYSKNKTDKINLTNHQNVSWVSKISNDSLLIYSGEDKLILLSLKLKDIVKIGDYISPAYNKQYKKIAVIEMRDDGMKEISSDILLLDLNGNKTTNLTKTPSNTESDIQWSHDGKRLVFSESGQIKQIIFAQNNPITK
jgi:hypothetical protein